MYAFIFFLQTLTENLSSLCVSDQCSTLHCKCNFCHSPRLFFLKHKTTVFSPLQKHSKECLHSYRGKDTCFLSPKVSVQNTTKLLESLLLTLIEEDYFSA